MLHTQLHMYYLDSACQMPINVRINCGHYIYFSYMSFVSHAVWTRSPSHVHMMHDNITLMPCARCSHISMARKREKKFKSALKKMLKSSKKVPSLSRGIYLLRACIRLFMFVCLLCCMGDGSEAISSLVSFGCTCKRIHMKHVLKYLSHAPPLTYDEQAKARDEMESKRMAALLEVHPSWQRDLHVLSSFDKLLRKFPNHSEPKSKHSSSPLIVIWGFDA